MLHTDGCCDQLNSGKSWSQRIDQTSFVSSMSNFIYVTCDYLCHIVYVESNNDHIIRGGNTSLRNRKNTWKMAWAKWSELVWKGLKTFFIQSPLYFKIYKIKSWGKPGEVRFFSVSLVSKLSIDQSAFRIRPRSLRSWTSDFRKCHFRPDYSFSKLDLY